MLEVVWYDSVKQANKITLCSQSKARFLQTQPARAADAHLGTALLIPAHSGWDLKSPAGIAPGPVIVVAANSPGMLGEETKHLASKVFCLKQVICLCFPLELQILKMSKTL